MLVDSAKSFPYLLPLLKHDPTEFYKCLTALFAGECFDDQVTLTCDATTHIDRQFVVYTLILACKKSPN